jgi:hypothetical protein
MRKRLGKTFIVLGFILFAASASFYFRNFPRYPDAAIGRVYPLNNHGTSPTLPVVNVYPNMR